MKKIMSVVLMSLIGLVGIYAWAGTAREDSVSRLQSSVDVLHAIIATPDKGGPEEVLSNAKCILVLSAATVEEMKVDFVHVVDDPGYGKGVEGAECTFLRAG